jgi:hypothetical protein
MPMLVLMLSVCPSISNGSLEVVDQPDRKCDRLLFASSHV